MLLLLIPLVAASTTIGDLVKYMTASWPTAPEHFRTAYSPCLDGLIVNFRSSGCAVIAQDPERLGPDSMGLICTAPTVSNGYTKNEHVIFATAQHDMRDFKGWDICCVDPNITMYIPEPGTGPYGK